MASLSSKDDAYDVSDPTDWLQTPLAALAPIEAALRCQVCKDFFTTPMITSCTHTFCSLCIRRALNENGRCPACRVEDQELKLRKDGALEDAVEAFKKARGGLLEHAKTPVMDFGNETSKRKVDDLAEEEGVYARKRTRSSSRRVAGSTQHTIVIDEEGDGDYVPEDGLVACPICGGRMTELAVSQHIDTCNGTPPTSNRVSKNLATQRESSSSRPSSSSAKKPERLPKLQYSMFRDQALKKKLSDLGIPNFGTRQLMEKRHTEWVTLWNANCDSKNPRTKSDLKRDLNIWERTQGAPPASTYGIAPASQITNKDFDRAAWSTTQDDSFKQLIANARKKPPVGVAKSSSHGHPPSATPIDANSSLPSSAPRSNHLPPITGLPPTELDIESSSSEDSDEEVSMNAFVNKIQKDDARLRAGLSPETSAISIGADGDSHQHLNGYTRQIPNRNGAIDISQCQSPYIQVDRTDPVIDSDLAAIKPLQP